MSMTSCEIASSSRSASGGSDFQCTADELYESFMEIVNNPELQTLNNVLERTSISEKDINDNKDALSSEESDTTNNQCTEVEVSDSSATVDTVILCTNAEKAVDTSDVCESINNVDVKGSKDLSDTQSVSETVGVLPSQSPSKNSALLLGIKENRRSDSCGKKEHNISLGDGSVTEDDNNCELSRMDSVTDNVFNEIIASPEISHKDISVEEECVGETESSQNDLNKNETQNSHDVAHDIEESIRMATQVCEEINEFIHLNRMSQSSDTVLSEKDEIDLDSSSVATKENNPLTDVNEKNLKEDTPNEESSPSEPLDKTGSCNINQNKDTQPPVTVSISAAHDDSSSNSSSIHEGSHDSDELSLHVELRKQSVSDSLCSSEGSLPDNMSTPEASPASGEKPSINWDVLNLALGSQETDEEDSGVYESRNSSYGGFGIVSEEDNSQGLSQPDNGRLRSISQSSTASEYEFKEKYQMQHSTGSLDRNKAGVLCSGYLLKLGGTGMTPKNWRRRWCILRHDRCLYYYKTIKDRVPCGIVVLTSYIVSRGSEFNKKNCLKLSKGGGRTYFFCTETQEDMMRWMEALRQAADMTDEGTNFEIREEIIHNVAIPALSIKKPDCHGYLTKQGARHRNSWKRRYCVLKDGCLYYYREMADTTALGVAKLHGYTVEDSAVSGKRHAFRALPPHPGMRTFSFFADNDYDKKRWIPCIEQSIKRQITAS